MKAASSADASGPRFSARVASILREPATGATLHPRDYGFDSPTQQFRASDGILSLVHPLELSGDDKKWNQFYERFAPFYELTQRLMGRFVFGFDVRKAWLEVNSRLPLARGARVLEISPGPGIMLELLRESIGPEGELVAVDLSRNMLRRCQRRTGVNACLIHANGEFLPFADESFDLVFHFGGVNLFSEPSRALTEFVRVARKGGVVSWGDEGFSPNYPDNFRKQMMIKMNPGYLRPRPPAPQGVADLQTYDAFDGLAYHIVAKKQ